MVESEGCEEEDAGSARTERRPLLQRVLRAVLLGHVGSNVVQQGSTVKSNAVSANTETESGPTEAQGKGVIQSADNTVETLVKEADKDAAEAGGNTKDVSVTLTPAG